MDGHGTGLAVSCDGVSAGVEGSLSTQWAALCTPGHLTAGQCPPELTWAPPSEEASGALCWQL